MTWRRLGVLPLDTAAAPWARTHAALPIAEARADGSWSLYLSLRDDEGRARIGRTRLTLEPSPQLAPLEAAPVLDVGVLGAFDDSGVVTSCLAADGNRRLLYYTGWARGVTVPFYLSTGVAVSVEGEPFARLSDGPLLDRNAVDPFLIASPFVLRDAGVWRMWYVSGTRWSFSDTGPRHHYHVRYAESGDGLAWHRNGTVCLDYAAGTDEHAFGRPCVLKHGDEYAMWYSVRGRHYVIGHAESRDGIHWVRRDELGGLRPAPGGWDSEMVEYPFVFERAGARYMLYNGNGYGKTGVGLAVWDRR